MKDKRPVVIKTTHTFPPEAINKDEWGPPPRNRRGISFVQGGPQSDHFGDILWEPCWVSLIGRPVASSLKVQQKRSAISYGLMEGNYSKGKRFMTCVIKFLPLIDCCWVTKWHHPNGDIIRSFRIIPCLVTFAEINGGTRSLKKRVTNDSEVHERKSLNVLYSKNLIQRIVEKESFIW